MADTGAALELVDALTGALMTDPVVAEDGHAYDRHSITAFIAQRQAEGRPLVSPQDMETPMGRGARGRPAKRPWP